MSPRSNIIPHLFKPKERIKWIGATDMAQKGATISSIGRTRGVDVRGRTKSM